METKRDYERGKEAESYSLQRSDGTGGWSLDRQGSEAVRGIVVVMRGIAAGCERKLPRGRDNKIWNTGQSVTVINS